MLKSINIGKQITCANMKVQYNNQMYKRSQSQNPRGNSLEDEQRYALQQIHQKKQIAFKEILYNSESIEEKAIATMYGMAIGDSWGHLYEFVPYNQNSDKETMQSLYPNEFQRNSAYNKFKLKPGQWTDDTSMGLCLLLLKGYLLNLCRIQLFQLADTLIQQSSNERFNSLLFKRLLLQWWEDGLNNAFENDFQREYTGSVGLGGCMAMALKEFKKIQFRDTNTGDTHTNGNGSLIRLAPVPIYFALQNSFNDALEVAEMQSKATHQGIEAADCCKLMTHIIIEALRSTIYSGNLFLESLDMRPVMPYLNSQTAKCIALSNQDYLSPSNSMNRVKEDRNWNWKSPFYRYSPTRAIQQPGYIGSYVSDALCMALHCIYHTSSFEQAVIKSINYFGDADSVGAVTGQIAGAIYGIKRAQRGINFIINTN